MITLNALNKPVLNAKDLFISPYSLGAYYIKSSFAKTEQVRARTIIKIEPNVLNHPHTHNLIKRVSYFAYGVIMMIPVINTIALVVSRYLYPNPILKQPPLPTINNLPKYRPAHQDAFNMNLAIIKPIYEKASPEERKFLAPIVTNYLSHVTPKHLDAWNRTFQKIDPSYESPEQSSPIQEYRYHRELLDQRLDYGQRFNRKLAFRDSSLFLLSDTSDVSHIFSSKFEVFTPRFDPSNPEKLSNKQQIVQQLVDFLTAQANSETPEQLKKPFLLDLSLVLADSVVIDDNAEKETIFMSKYRAQVEEFRNILKSSIDVVLTTHPKYSGLADKVLSMLVNNTTCIVRTRVDEACGIKMLPFGKYKTRSDQFQSPLVSFMINSGTSIGAINLRKLIPDVFNQIGSLPDFGLSSGSIDMNLYRSKADFMNLGIVRRLKIQYLFGSVLSFESLNSQKTKPHFLLMGKATLNLIHGLMSEISEETWEAVRANPVKNYLCQTALYQIYLHLSNAENYERENQFSHYMQEMEIVHAEIQKLLQIFSPFKQDLFEEILKQELKKTNIPSTLFSSTRAGVGRSATNICAGVVACAQQINPNFESASAQESYYEHMIFMKHDYASFIKDPKGKKLDLYHAQFNPNVNVGSQLTEYKRRDIASEIRDLFKNNLVSSHFTAAIDITIDEFYSSNVRDLLQEFEPDIQDGRINFVFFASGQKFSSMGMDNYYGAPFYIVNNRAKKWSPYLELLSNPCYRTDDLSANWYCLSTKYAPDALSNYRKLIFSNTRDIISKLPPELLPDAKVHKKFRVNKASAEMLPAFIDLKVQAQTRSQQTICNAVQSLFIKHAIDENISAYQRGSFGFFHCNFAVFGPMDDSVRTIRINPGINPEDNKKLAKFFWKLLDT